MRLPRMSLGRRPPLPMSEVSSHSLGPTPLSACHAVITSSSNSITILVALTCRLIAEAIPVLQSILPFVTFCLSCLRFPLAQKKKRRKEGQGNNARRACEIVGVIYLLSLQSSAPCSKRNKRKRKTRREICNTTREADVLERLSATAKRRLQSFKSTLLLYRALHASLPFYPPRQEREAVHARSGTHARATQPPSSRRRDKQERPKCTSGVVAYPRSALKTPSRGSKRSRPATVSCIQAPAHFCPRVVLVYRAICASCFAAGGSGSLPVLIMHKLDGARTPSGQMPTLVVDIALVFLLPYSLFAFPSRRQSSTAVNGETCRELQH